ncbi:Golgi membrane exchange factor (Ric1p-Rgp1p) subunit [Recurvomyces mirabilis]|uniref:Golgi membrane exchange factor (Ric1p-Rgp1p) subunit n=1 Tax=Recurvomyces mirabilis TaxID=574656 RepID=A0AAE0WNU0_9PEZI|nr:Golgi membrane exchange factor (Ric1p-Rgp1p) subunit [Recurvomyces mirabilis]KAK5158409.1 Golgi membrane exchange factor (Ric1p-Rgp1p) subunit [Recurvomyces mirabilis]
MPPTSALSNIRAFVQWREPSVYAGEVIECIITFRNIARTCEQEEGVDSETPLANGHSHGRTASNAPSAAGSRRASVAQLRPAPSRAGSSGMAARSAPGVRGHRPTLSLNVVSAESKSGLHSAPLPMKTPPSAMRSAKGHGRSLSIMSLGSDAPSDSRAPHTAPVVGKRPARGHGRSASLQVTTRGATTSHTAHGLGITAARQPSPLYESSTPPAMAEDALPLRPPRRRPGTVSADSTPNLGGPNGQRRSSKPNALDTGFKFPAQPAIVKDSSPPKPRPRSPSTMHSAQQRPISPRPPEGWSGALSNLNPVTRVMSESSTMSSTPRSSGDFYSMSNNSDETLTSEAPILVQQDDRLLPRVNPVQQTPRSRQSSYRQPAEPETLMMGYAQTMGRFILDGSLVNAAPFEEVKRKGVQSGGGVVGIERSKRSSGMFGAFSWGNIGESLGGLLGGDDMSSMALMKATAGSRSVPLLSTPQNLLFVDLRLAPGESKSINYSFALPRGLPPSHRGRAIKVQYYLTLGIQRPGGQAIKQVEIPFRVLGSYNARGETLGHDLMSPYVLLQDAARSKSITPGTPSISGLPTFLAKEPQKTQKTPKQGLEDFLRYTERLLSETRDTNGALLSPTSPPSHSPMSSPNDTFADHSPGTIREAIDLAILRSNHVPTNSQNPSEAAAASPNRFNIARSGQPVAVLTLLRPAYRLGEAVTGTIDFTAPGPGTGLHQAPTYSILIELESAERVDPSLALRSTASINRVTRKTYASVAENTLFARTVSFSLAIPASATPTFETTGVNLVWRLRVEFITARSVPAHGYEEGREEDHDYGLLEELGTDERGTVLIAKERLMAESFDIEVPLKVYGVAGLVSDGAGVGSAQALEV